MRTGHRLRTRAAAAAVPVILGACACAGPTSDDADYRHKAANSAEALASQVQSAALTGRLVLGNRVPLRYAAVTVGELDDDASSVQETFDSRQPPATSAADDLRDRLDSVMQDATGAITDLRIAIRRGSDSGIRKALDELSKVAPKLDALEKIA